MRGYIRMWLEWNNEFVRAAEMDSIIKIDNNPDENLFRFVQFYRKPLPFLHTSKTERMFSAATIGHLKEFKRKSKNRISVPSEQRKTTNLAIIHVLSVIYFSGLFILLCIYPNVAPVFIAAAVVFAVLLLCA